MNNKNLIYMYKKIKNMYTYRVICINDKKNFPVKRKIKDKKERNVWDIFSIWTFLFEVLEKIWIKKETK